MYSFKTKTSNVFLTKLLTPILPRKSRDRTNPYYASQSQIHQLSRQSLAITTVRPLLSSVSINLELARIKFMFYISLQLEETGGTFPRTNLKTHEPSSPRPKNLTIFILIDLENIMKIYFTPKDIFSARGPFFVAYAGV